MMGNEGLFVPGGRDETREQRVERWWLGMFGRKLYQVGGGGGILRCSASSAVHNRKTENMQKMLTFSKCMILILHS